MPRVIGPRGTGKFTWTGQQWPDALRLDLLRAEVEREPRVRPGRLRERPHATAEVA